MSSVHISRVTILQYDKNGAGIITVVAGIGSLQNGLQLLQLLMRPRVHAVDQQLLYRQVVDLLRQREETMTFVGKYKAALRLQANPIQIRFLLRSHFQG